MTAVLLLASTTGGLVVAAAVFLVLTRTIGWLRETLAHQLLVTSVIEERLARLERRQAPADAGVVRGLEWAWRPAPTARGEFPPGEPEE